MDANRRTDGLEFRTVLEPDLVNRRMQWLAQHQFVVPVLAEQHLLNGAAAADAAV